VSPDQLLAPTREPVVLDIGGEIGALIVYAEAELVDTPIEVSPTGSDTARFHQHILERPLPHGTSYAAVFDKITQGEYTLWLHDQARLRDFEITGGSVSQIDWRTAAGGEPVPLQGASPHQSLRCVNTVDPRG